jgi:hypothetical protein
MRKFVQIFAVLTLIFFAHIKIASAQQPTQQTCCPANKNLGYVPARLYRIENKTCVYRSSGGAILNDTSAYACNRQRQVCIVNYADLPSSRCVESPRPVRPNDGCGNNLNYINTAFGCLDTTPGAIISIVLRLGIGIGSGIALLLIILGSFKVLTSQGQPDQINQGKETITASIIGIVFITLSIVILQIIGIDILGLNDLGSLKPIPLGR